MTRRRWLFVLGVATLIGAVLPPIDVEAAKWFAVHMVQHMCLLFVSAPLIAGSRVIDIRPRLLRSVVVVAALQAVVLWAWHLPVLYDAAMRNDALHVLEHASFIVAGVLFWTVVFDRAEDRFKRVALVFVTMLQSGALGVVIAFAAEPLYEWHSVHTPDGSLGIPRVMAQQQLAGAIMWIPPGIVYLAVMVALIAQALNAFDAAEQP